MYQILEKGRFIPSVLLRRGETVIDPVSGHAHTVHAPYPGKWVDTDGNIHEGGAFEAVDMTENPAACATLYLTCWTKGIVS